VIGWPPSPAAALSITGPDHETLGEAILFPEMEKFVNVREVRHADAAEWMRMRRLLWPDDDHAGDIARYFAGDAMVSCPGGTAAVLVAERDGGLCGFVEVGMRPFADGCETRPVGYVEGWFVDEGARRRGAGGALIAAAEAWARAHGCREIASDCHLDNVVSLRAHLALGFAETERAIHFRKPL
jgi:aminoglycoside 6'-N-acetyltransferase I